MDRLNQYRQTIKQVMNDHVKFIPSHGQIETLGIADTESDNYLVLDVGWDRGKRVHALVFHIRIRDGKIWIDDDWTEDGVACELVEAGVPHQDIVLAFHPAEMRQYIGLTQLACHAERSEASRA